jgi:hypothetical protein
VLIFKRIPGCGIVLANHTGALIASRFGDRDFGRSILTSPLDVPSAPLTGRNRPYRFEFFTSDQSPETIIESIVSLFIRITK